MKLALTDLTAAEIAAGLNLEAYRGRQLFAWLQKRQVFDFDDMTDLSKELRARLKEEAIPRQLEIREIRESADSPGTRKYLFDLQDGEAIESVVLRDRERFTFCLSTQVGCGLACVFCATGAMGFRRDLTAGEIAEQALHLAREEAVDDRSPNLVYMGMGEPFRNYDAVKKSIQLLMDKNGLNVGARRITISTAGDVPGILRFTDEDWQVRLSVSLHAADDELRSRLVPLNRTYGIEELMGALQSYYWRTARRFTFEWTLIAGVNDRMSDARALASYARQFQATVNIIACNEVPGLGFSAPEPIVCERFMGELERCGVTVTLRQERGGDVEAACGQLRAGSISRREQAI